MQNHDQPSTHGIGIIEALNDSTAMAGAELA